MTRRGSSTEAGEDQPHRVHRQTQRHDEDGGAGQYRGGKGVVLDYRVTADEVYLTYATTRSANPPLETASGPVMPRLGWMQATRPSSSMWRHTPR